MLLRLIKTNRNAGYLFFPLVLLALFVLQLKLPGALPDYAHENARLIPGIPDHLLRNFPAVKLFLASLAVFATSLLLFRINREFIFLNSWSMLPVFVFLFLVVGLPPYGQLHPVWFAGLLFLPAISRLFQAFDWRKPYRNVFESGFLLGLGSLFYFHLLILLPAFVIGARMIPRDARWREPFLVTLGALVPWMLIFSVYFLLDGVPVLTEWVKISILQRDESILKNLPLLIFSGVVVLLIFSGSMTILRQFSEKKVRFRKFFTFFFFTFLMSVLSYVLIPGCHAEMLVITAVPVSFLLSNYFDTVKRSVFKEIAFLMIAVLGFTLLSIQMKLWPGF